MLWMITKDIINADEPWDRVGCCNDELLDSLDARSRVPEAQRQDIIDCCNYEFRLLDDDGELYYEGVCKDLDDQDGDSAFDPMDRYQNCDGCTTMEYRKKGETEWRQL